MNKTLSILLTCIKIRKFRIFYSEIFLLKQYISKISHYQYHTIFFRALKIVTFCMARCVFVPTNFSSFASKDSLAFFAKRGKNCGTCFFINKLDLIFQISPKYSFLIFRESRLIQTILI